MSILLKSAQVVRDIVDNDLSLDKSWQKNQLDVRPNDRAIIKETAQGSCRYYFFLQAILTKLLSKPFKARFRDIHFLLVCGLYQILYLRRPQHAIVNECVEALNQQKLKWAKPLVNATLRNFIRNQDSILKQNFSAAERVAFSPYLYSKIVLDWPDYANEIISASNQRPPLTLRINQQKMTRQDYATILRDAGIDFVFTEDSSLGLTISNPISVESIPLFFDGVVSVQDESAQLVTEFMPLEKNQTILDGCAAPGGKTCLMLEQQPDTTMVAVDLPARSQTINQNLNRLGLNATVIVENLLVDSDWKKFSPFDKILLDVPCSGSGVIRRHSDIKLRRKQGDIEKFSAQQLELLNRVWGELKPNGVLLYVTCSIFNEENDAVIEKFISDKRQIRLQFSQRELGLKTRFGRQRLPGVHNGDGFYYCQLQKTPHQLSNRLHDSRQSNN